MSKSGKKGNFARPWRAFYLTLHALATREPRDAWLKAAVGLPADFKTSMLQSLEKGSATEIDFINGAVVRWGHRCGVPTPINQALVAGIKGIEHHMRLQAA